MRRSAWALREEADQFIASEMDTAILPANKIGFTTTPKVPTKDDAYEYLVDLGVLLDEGNTPTDGRFCIVPHGFTACCLKTTGSSVRYDARRRSAGEWRGRRGRGISHPESNNVPIRPVPKLQDHRGHARATAYVDQVLDVQTYKPEKRFGDAVKGLHVYGAKVVRLSPCLPYRE
jgi:hypothetical protein